MYDALTVAETARRVDLLICANAASGVFDEGDEIWYEDHGDLRPGTVDAVDGDRYVVTYAVNGYSLTMRAMACDLTRRSVP